MKGTNLRQYRLSKGIRQDYLAEKMGMLQGNLSRLEGCDKPLKLTYPQWMAVKNVLNLDDIQMGAHE